MFSGKVHLEFGGLATATAMLFIVWSLEFGYQITLVICGIHGIIMPMCHVLYVYDMLIYI